MYKGGSPWEIIRGYLERVNKLLLSLPPIILDNHPPWKGEDLVPKEISFVNVEGYTCSGG